MNKRLTHDTGRNCSRSKAGSELLLALLLMFGVREAKKRVGCELEEELVERIDRIAKLLNTNRADIIKGACVLYLTSIEIDAKRRTKARIDDL